MTYFMLYLLTSVGKISALLKLGGVFFWIALVISAFIVVISMVIATETKDTFKEVMYKSKEMFYKPMRFVMIAGALSYSIGTLLPTERDLAIIIGGGITYEALSSDKGKEIGGKAVDLLLKKIDEALEEPKTNNELTTGEVL